MAKATLIPAEPEVQLTLSKAEAQTLVDAHKFGWGLAFNHAKEIRRQHHGCFG